MTIPKKPIKTREATLVSKGTLTIETKKNIHTWRRRNEKEVQYKLKIVQKRKRTCKVNSEKL